MAGKGKPRGIKSPEELYKLFEAYKKHTKDNPRIKVEYVGKDGMKVKTPLEVPLTLVGFYNYCYKNASDVHNYFENTGDRYNSYKGICRVIRGEIRQDQIEGGMASIFNPSITQRLNGLTDKQQIDTTQSIKILNIDPLDDGANNGTKENS